MQIGYCTNVHAGPDLETTQANLLQYASNVKQQFSPETPMGVGLWLAAPAAASDGATSVEPGPQIPTLEMAAADPHGARHGPQIPTLEYSNDDSSPVILKGVK